jgi:hypothetical protein
MERSTGQAFGWPGSSTLVADGSLLEELSFKMMGREVPSRVISSNEAISRIRDRELIDLVVEQFPDMQKREAMRRERVVSRDSFHELDLGDVPQLEHRGPGNESSTLTNPCSQTQKGIYRFGAFAKLLESREASTGVDVDEYLALAVTKQLEICENRLNPGENGYARELGQGLPCAAARSDTLIFQGLLHKSATRGGQVN